MSKQVFDIVIVGAGPIGLACALSAKKAGLSYLVIEKGPLVNSLYHYPVRMQFFSTSEKLEIEGIPFISKAAKPSKREALEYYRRIATSNDLNIHLFETVKNIEKKKNTFLTSTDKDSYQSKNIVLAMGFYDRPVLLNIPGENLSKVSHYYDDPHLYAFQNVVVVGASNSAVDAALEIYRKGGNVTMVVRGDSIGDRVKYWVKPDIENRIKEGSIDAHFNSELVKIKTDQVVVRNNKSGKKFKLDNDFVLALTGYRPDFDFMRSLGIELQGSDLIPMYDENTMETNVDGLYLAGVMCGGMQTHKWFIENSRVHADLITTSIASK
jgi:thioredoxin reductase (NADPH)